MTVLRNNIYIFEYIRIKIFFLFKYSFKKKKILHHD